MTEMQGVRPRDHDTRNSRTLDRARSICTHQGPNSICIRTQSVSPCTLGIDALTPSSAKRGIVRPRECPRRLRVRGTSLDFRPDEACRANIPWRREHL